MNFALLPSRGFTAGAAAWAALARDAWRGLTRRHWAGAFALGIAATMWENASLGPWQWETQWWNDLPRSFLFQQIVVMSLLLAVAVADRAVDTGLARRSAYAIAVVLGVCCGSAIASAALLDVCCNSALNSEVTRPWDRWASVTIYHSALWLMFGGLATYVYVDRKRARAAEVRLQAAEIQRNRKAKEVLGSRLQAMQARVEPQFLFNTLAQVKDLYHTEPALGDGMLDDLIAYLRAAVPRMRDTSSTLAQEIELAGAYLAIVKVRLGDRLTYAIDVPEDLGDARMPPMMLLPLIDHAIVRGVEPSRAGGSIRISVCVDGDRLTLTLGDSDSAFAPERSGDDGIKSIRERLETLYGRDASLALGHDAQRGTQAVLGIPYERAQRSDH